MHIAVCMDTAPDRKQLERLLGRSADRRIAADPDVPYYVQAYGNKEALLARPFLYDLFFIDLLHGDMNSIELIRTLRGQGVTATICLCPGEVDLSGELTDEDKVLILRQPVKVEELEHILDIALEEQLAREPKIDIRSNTETVHVREDEFMYAEQLKDMIAVHLTDGREIICSELLENFAARTESFSNIFYLPDDLVAHRQAIGETRFGSVVLTDGKKFKVSRRWLKYMESVIYGR